MKPQTAKLHEFHLKLWVSLTSRMWQKCHPHPGGHYYVMCVTWPPNTPGNLSVQPGWCLTSWSKPRGTQTRAGYSVSRPHAALCDLYTANWVHTAASMEADWLHTTRRLSTTLGMGGSCACWCREKVHWGLSGHSYLFPEFSSDVAEPLGSIKAHGLQTAVPQHFNHLSIFWKTHMSRRVKQETSILFYSIILPGSTNWAD